MANIPAHHEAVAVAKAALQTALKTAADEPARTAAQVIFHKAVLASGRLNGVHCNSIAQLQRLGVDMGNWTAQD